MQIFDANEWTQFYPEKEQDHVIELPRNATKVDFTVRGVGDVAVSFVNGDGEAIPYSHGREVAFSGRIKNTFGLSIRASHPFAYVCTFRDDGKEVVDPVPLQISVVNNDRAAIGAMVQTEVQRVINQMKATGRLPDDYSADDLEDDLLGELDFEDDDDMLLGDGPYAEEEEPVVPPEESPAEPDEPSPAPAPDEPPSEPSPDA